MITERRHGMVVGVHLAEPEYPGGDPEGTSFEPYDERDMGVRRFLGLEPPLERPPYRLYKSVFIGRMTEVEAQTMEAVLSAADAKLRMLFNSVEYFVSDDPLFGSLQAAVSSVLGEDRSAELLAAES